MGPSSGPPELKVGPGGGCGGGFGTGGGGGGGGEGGGGGGGGRGTVPSPIGGGTICLTVVPPPFEPEVLSLCAFAEGTYSSHARRRANPVAKIISIANAARNTARFLRFTCPPSGKHMPLRHILEP